MAVGTLLDRLRGMSWLSGRSTAFTESMAATNLATNPSKSERNLEEQESRRLQGIAF